MGGPGHHCPLFGLGPCLVQSIAPICQKGMPLPDASCMGFPKKRRRRSRSRALAVMRRHARVLASHVTGPTMPESPAQDRKTKRTALSREARRLADEMENLYIREQIGAMAMVRQYMATHSEASSRLDLLQTAKALRCCRPRVPWKSENPWFRTEERKRQLPS